MPLGLEELSAVKERYDRAVSMARESKCFCNSARHSGVLYRELVDFLLEGDQSGDPSGDPFSEHNCPLHGR